MKGLGETCKNICRRYGVEVYFRGGSTIRDLLVHPKDRDTILKKSGVINRYRCGRVDCEEEYIGESHRNIWWEIQGTHESTIIHHGPPEHHRPMKFPWTISVLWVRNTTVLPGTLERSYFHQSKWPIPQQKHWQVPAATHLGWGAGKITRITS